MSPRLSKLEEMGLLVNVLLDTAEAREAIAEDSGQSDHARILAAGKAIAYRQAAADIDSILRGVSP